MYNQCLGYWPAISYLPVKNNGKWGAIDTGGNQALPCEYFNPPYISDGLAAVANEEPATDIHGWAPVTYRYIDLEGNTALDGFTHKCSGYGTNWWRFIFSEGVALRLKAEQENVYPPEYELMDKTGRRIWTASTAVSDWYVDFFHEGMIVFNGQIITREGTALPASIGPDVRSFTRAEDGTFFIYYRRGVKVIGNGFDRYFPNAIGPADNYPEGNPVHAPYAEGAAAWLCYGDPAAQTRPIMRLFNTEGTLLAELGGEGLNCIYNPWYEIITVKNADDGVAAVYDAGGRELEGYYTDGSRYLPYINIVMPRIDYPAPGAAEDD